MTGASPEPAANLEDLETDFNDAAYQYRLCDPTSLGTEPEPYENPDLESIDQALKIYEVDCEVILRELPQYGGGIEQNEDRIARMRQTLPQLEEAIARVEATGKYEAKVLHAKTAVESLKQILTGLPE